MSLYRLFVPKQAVGTDKDYFDLFNVTGSGLDLEILSVRPVVSGAVAVVGELSVDLILARTTAVGTGGTGATYEGVSPTAMTICAVNSSQRLNTHQVSARLTPSGGATIGAVLSWTTVFTEETSPGTYAPVFDLAREGGFDQPGVMVSPGTGVKVRQGVVASVGNIGFNVLFKTYPK